MAPRSKYPPGEPCECHGVPKQWQTDGHWRCTVKRRKNRSDWRRANPDYQRVWHEANPGYDLTRVLLPDGSRPRFGEAADFARSLRDQYRKENG